MPEPNAFEQHWADGAAEALLDTFGEDVTYTPYGGAAVTIRAEIVRGPFSTRESDRGRRIDYATEAWLRRSDVTTLNVQGDTLAAKKRITDANATTFRVTQLIEQTAAMWRVRLD